MVHRIELLSVHTPKCGGMSLLSALRAAYGRELYPDYGDFPADPAARMHLDPDGFLAAARDGGYPWLAGRSAVHGHFWLRKYDGVPAIRFTLLREPVDRIISLYHYWKSGTEGADHPMVRFIAMYVPDVLVFAEMEWTRTYLTRRFFRDMGVDAFDLIGFHERMGAAMARLSSLIGRPLELPVRNANAFDGYADEVARIRDDARLMARLRAATDEERRFYDAALDRFG